MATESSRFMHLVRRLWANEYLRAAGAVGLTVLVCLPARSAVNSIDIVILFLLTVVIVSASLSRGPAILAVIASTAAFDFFFVPPYQTFAVLDRSYLFTFAVMFVVALIISRLTGTIREQAIEARRGEARASALYEMIRDLAETRNRDSQLATVARHLGRVVDGEADVVMIAGWDASGDPDWPSSGVFDDIELRLTATWVARHGQSAGWDTTRASVAEGLIAPIPGPHGVQGVVVVRPPSFDRRIEDHDIRTVEVLAEQAGRVLARPAAIGAA